MMETNKRYVEREFPIRVYANDARAFDTIAVALRTGDTDPYYIQNGKDVASTLVLKGWGGNWVIGKGYDTAVITGPQGYVFGNVKIDDVFIQKWIKRAQQTREKANRLCARNRIGDYLDTLATVAIEFREALKEEIEKNIEGNDAIKKEYAVWLARENIFDWEMWKSGKLCA